MEYDRVVQLTSEALMMCLILSLPAVVTSAVVGLLVSFLQAVTSLQDASISQGVKLLCVTVVVALAAPWAGATVVRFAQRLMQVMFV